MTGNEPVLTEKSISFTRSTVGDDNRGASVGLCRRSIARSDVGQSLRFGALRVTSRLPQSADIDQPAGLVRFVPTPEVATGCFPRSTITRALKPSPR